MLQAGKSFLDSAEYDTADWYYKQLRAALVQLDQMIADVSLLTDDRQNAQLLQFHTLQGSMVIACKQGHRVSLNTTCGDNLQLALALQHIAGPSKVGWP